ncbi:hypothetical protein EI94DRAFT_1706846 [Lactarius quietus]|nr:hypothetical protein EI94DRAFT_1706846 [Lactarius quietus]
MPRIVEDPTWAICPNFDGLEWEFFRQSAITAHQGDQPLTPEEAVQCLKEAWTCENEHLVVAWVEQLEQDQAEQQNAEPEAENNKAKKRKNKKKIFNPDHVIAEWLGPRPSQYALGKIENMEYIELDYFTFKGCKDAAIDANKSINNDTLAFVQLGSSIAVRPMAAVKPSRHVRNDKDLGWEEMMDAKNIMLHFMTKSGAWPEAHAESMAAFFFNLNLHLRKMQMNGKAALLLYQSRTRHEWFDALKRNEGFNIQIIQEELLRSCAEEVNNAICERDDAKYHRDDAMREKEFEQVCMLASRIPKMQH